VADPPVPDSRGRGDRAGLFSGDGALAKLVEAVVNEILQGQVTEQLGATRYERTEQRAGYRNGSRPRTLIARVGTLILRVPQVVTRQKRGPDCPGSLDRPARESRLFSSNAQGKTGEEDQPTGGPPVSAWVGLSGYRHCPGAGCEARRRCGAQSQGENGCANRPRDGATRRAGRGALRKSPWAGPCAMASMAAVMAGGRGDGRAAGPSRPGP